MSSQLHFNLVKNHATSTKASHVPSVAGKAAVESADCGCSHGCDSAAIKPETQPIPAGCRRTKLHIAQMCCPTEEALIRKSLARLPGVVALEFNLMQRVLTVDHQPGSLPAIEAAIRSIGMTAQIPNPAGSTAEPAIKQSAPVWPLVLAGLAAIGAEAVHWANLPEWLSALLALITICTCGLDTYRKGWQALRHGDLNINALMSIAVSGALIIGQWPEAAMVMFLFTIAELIEDKSLDRVRHAIQGLLQLSPETATVQHADGSWREMATHAVAVGSRVKVRPGERIGLDGIIELGQSSIDQAPITGESLPVDKGLGDAVYAGTLNQTGAFEYRVTAAASQTTLARIIHAVETAQASRAPVQRLVDRFARVYTPLVLLIAVAVAVIPPLWLGGAWFDWIYKALVLLVIACPCALVISTPVSIVSGLAAAARHGILIKGGAYLEQGRKLRWLAIDKTGTLTHGKPALTGITLLGTTPQAQAMQIACSLAEHSDHPVSRAIAQASQAEQIPRLTVDAFTSIPGRGVRGLINGQIHHLGNHRLIHELGLCSSELEARLAPIESQGQTVVLLCDETQVLALFAVADTLKSHSREAIAALHDLGIQVVMLSGDNPHTVQAIAAQAGLDDARGNQLPEDKLQVIESLARRGIVGMVGDGINDAPALARANIGFAMGAAGSDTAIETADVALMDDDLRKIARFVRLSQATFAILQQNIALALGIKAIFLLLTVLGYGTMWMAVFADMGTSLLVVGNGLRLLRK